MKRLWSGWKTRSSTASAGLSSSRKATKGWIFFGTNPDSRASYNACGWIRFDPRNCLPQRLPLVPGTADHGPLRPALVRRNASRLERLLAVFPGGAAGRIRVRALARIAAPPSHSRPAAGGVPGIFAGDSVQARDYG